MKRIELEKKYPWIAMHNSSIEDYIPPAYYDSLLKDYVFLGKEDIEYFSEYLHRVFSSENKKLGNVLELGGGTGRGTDVLLKEVEFGGLDIVDLSEEMTDFTAGKYSADKRIAIFKDDSIDFMSNSKVRYDFVFSLWSFSHSVHQHMVDDGQVEGEAYVRKVIEEFISHNMRLGSKFFLIHFDSLSDEQRILVRQWEKFFPIFSLKEQSPSKRMLDDIFSSLEKNGRIKFHLEHLIGDPIRYSSLDEALEIFINFHMEMEFNKTDHIEMILDETKSDMRQYRNEDGSYSIRPGCFIYSFEKIVQ